jgi:NAD(P)-dependent dehydrogenase (short-subunit alcohol dehydrogenase family)
MTISLENHVVVVTGGAKRLGRAIALECARAGASVAITYNRSREEALQTVRDSQEISPDQVFKAYQLEVSDARAVKAFVDEVWNDFGCVTMLVNNAAIFRRTPFDFVDEGDFDDHIDSNLKGPFLLCRAFGHRFKAQGEGHIVNFADIYAARPLANYVPYCVSKAGVLMLTQSLAKSLAPDVRVNCICPGTILKSSESQDEEDETLLVGRIPMNRMGTPLEIAQTTVFLLGGPRFITGALLVVDGGQSLR